MRKEIFANVTIFCCCFKTPSVSDLSEKMKFLKIFINSSFKQIIIIIIAISVDIKREFDLVFIDDTFTLKKYIFIQGHLRNIKVISNNLSVHLFELL